MVPALLSAPESEKHVQILTLIAGIACLFFALLDAFQTVILPRRATGKFRITHIFYIVTWGPWSWISSWVKSERKRKTMLSVYGPLSLVLLIVIWAGALVVGFAFIFYGLGSPFSDPLGRTVGLRSDMYVSGTTLFTLGLGDVVPRRYIIRDLVILEAGMGLGFVAMVIGYFPVLYGAFSRREVSISLLDARAGSPPTAVELLHRHSFDGGNAALILLLEEWERWSAELLESHIFLSAALLFPFPTHAPELAQCAHCRTRYLRSAHLRCTGIACASGSAYVRHGAACACRSGAGLLSASGKGYA